MKRLVQTVTMQLTRVFDTVDFLLPKQERWRLNRMGSKIIVKLVGAALQHYRNISPGRYTINSGFNMLG